MIYYSSLRTGAIASAIALLTVFSQPAAAQISNVLIAPGKAKMVPIDKFTPDVTVADSAFECGTPETHPADLLLPVDAIAYSAAVPNRATERMSIVVFVDSTGSILRFAERRGDPVRPDTKGMPPSQVGAAVQAAALQTRSTTISVDFRMHRATAANRGGGGEDVMSTGNPDVVAKLEALGKPGDLAARVVAVCSGRK
jgi:hypothetical protein